MSGLLKGTVVAKTAFWRRFETNKKGDGGVIFGPLSIQKSGGNQTVETLCVVWMYLLGRFPAMLRQVHQDDSFIYFFVWSSFPENWVWFKSFPDKEMYFWLMAYCVKIPKHGGQAMWGHHQP